MGLENGTKSTLSLVRRYLEDLLDSGVEDLPRTVDTIELRGTRDNVCHDQTIVSTEGETLGAIKLNMGECQRCQLGKGRTNLVFGVGNSHARIVFVGEAPGRDEDIKGIPFVGKAGEVLTRLIERMGLKREDVYICNVLKCRPPNNRNPQPEEVEQCAPFMLRQVMSIKPELIVSLGTFATQALLQSKGPISKLRGKFYDYHGIPLMPTFHPSFLLRNGPDMRWLVWNDMVQVLNLLGLPIPDLKRKNE